MSIALPPLLISVPEGVIDLSWGHPSERLHPRHAIRKAIDHMFADGNVMPLQYGPEQGFGPLLESLAGFLSREESYNAAIAPEALYVTGGASQGLDMTCTLLTQAGDVAYVEEPTYYLVSKIFNDHRLRIVGVPTDSLGIQTDALSRMLHDPAIPNPKLLYVIPTFHNPLGVVLPSDRRRRLIQLAEEFDFTIASDEAYQLLHYTEAPPPPLAMYDTCERGVAVSLGSFSKILAPGLHLGWIHARPELIRRFVDMGLSTSGGSMNQFTANVAHSVIELGLLEDNVSLLRKTYGGRVSELAKALHDELDEEVEFATPDGGYFFWVTCRNVDTEDLLSFAREAGVTFRPGQAFSASHSFPQQLRLTFALCEPEELKRGVKRLAYALQAYRKKRGL